MLYCQLVCVLKTSRIFSIERTLREKWNCSYLVYCLVILIVLNDMRKVIIKRAWLITILHYHESYLKLLNLRTCLSSQCSIVMHVAFS